MEKNFYCPYCLLIKPKYASSFKSWASVRAHTSTCTANDGSYYILNTLGPVLLTEFSSMPIDEIKQKYPTITPENLTDILKKLKTKNLVPKSFTFRILYSKEEIISKITSYYKKYGKIPGIRDFGSNNSEYPNHDTVKTHFGTWNNAILAAGFAPNTKSGYGTKALGLDGHLYRSTAEAYFADNYLYGKYSYDIEPKYQKPYNMYYDWYVKELNLYIELDGGLRPQRIKEKIEINNNLNIRCVIINTKHIYNSEKVLRYLINEN